MSGPDRWGRDRFSTCFYIIHMFYNLKTSVIIGPHSSSFFLVVVLYFLSLSCSNLFYLFFIRTYIREIRRPAACGLFSQGGGAILFLFFDQNSNNIHKKYGKTNKKYGSLMFAPWIPWVFSHVFPWVPHRSHGNPSWDPSAVFFFFIKKKPLADAAAL